MDSLKIDFNFRFNMAAYTCCINSGLRYEKPAKSFWSRFIMNSLSVGVRSTFSEVNCLSKFETSFRCR